MIRPYNTRKSNEIIAAPKVYGFDTGFVRCLQGWRDLRPNDYGILWEHYVLNQLISMEPRRTVYYWRDKQKHEVDFVLHQKGRAPLAIECKWSRQVSKGQERDLLSRCFATLQSPVRRSSLRIRRNRRARWPCPW